MRTDNGHGSRACRKNAITSERNRPLVEGGRGEGRRGGGEREREDDGGGEVEEEIYRVELQRRLTPEFTMCRRYWRDLLRER